MDPYQVLALFVGFMRDFAQSGDATSANILADRFEEAGYPLAGITREIANATLNIPDKIAERQEAHTIARGTGWRIEYAPGQRGRAEGDNWIEGRNATVSVVWSDEGDWRKVVGQPIPLAPGVTPATQFCDLVPLARQISQNTLASHVTVDWAGCAYRACCINILSGLLVGRDCAYAYCGVVAPVPRCEILSRPLERLMRQVGLEVEPHRSGLQGDPSAAQVHWRDSPGGGRQNGDEEDEADFHSLDQ
jgi:hypothetical protein